MLKGCVFINQFRGRDLSQGNTVFPELSEIWRKETIGRLLLLTKKL